MTLCIGHGGKVRTMEPAEIPPGLAIRRWPRLCAYCYAGPRGGLEYSHMSVQSSACATGYCSDLLSS